MLQVVRQDSSI